MTKSEKAATPLAITAGRQSDVLVDALPYIDQGYDETAHAAALGLIEEECRRYRPTKNYLAHLPQPSYDCFVTPVLKNEIERMQNRQPMEIFNMKRYELPCPPAGKVTDVGAWQEAVNNSQAQLEHQALRITNLELMSEYGCEAWKTYNEMLQNMCNECQKQLTNLRREIQEINLDRKRKQIDAGEKLKNLEASWVGLVTKNYEIERACADLEKEVMPLRKKYKTEQKPSET